LPVWGLGIKGLSLLEREGGIPPRQGVQVLLASISVICVSSTCWHYTLPPLAGSVEPNDAMQLANLLRLSLRAFPTIRSSRMQHEGHA
jgi:hypothetical protein